MDFNKTQCKNKLTEEKNKNLQVSGKGSECDKDTTYGSH